MAHVSETAPTHCAACYGQYPQRRYVDMGAAYDGPVIEGGVMTDEGVKNSLKVAIDELVLCEDCVRDAARLLGLSEQNTQHNDQLEADNRLLRERLLGLDQYVKKLEAAFEVRPKPATRKTTVKEQANG